jgi:hypothetical protein
LGYKNGITIFEMLSSVAHVYLKDILTYLLEKVVEPPIKIKDSSEDKNMYFGIWIGTHQFKQSLLL